MNNKGTDQTVLMGRLVSTCVDPMLHYGLIWVMSIMFMFRISISGDKAYIPSPKRRGKLNVVIDALLGTITRFPMLFETCVQKGHSKWIKFHRASITR